MYIIVDDIALYNKYLCVPDIDENQCGVNSTMFPLTIPIWPFSCVFPKINCIYYHVINIFIYYLIIKAFTRGKRVR